MNNIMFINVMLDITFTMMLSYIYLYRYIHRWRWIGTRGSFFKIPERCRSVLKAKLEKTLFGFLTFTYYGHHSVWGIFWRAWYKRKHLKHFKTTNAHSNILRDRWQDELPHSILKCLKCLIRTTHCGALMYSFRGNSLFYSPFCCFSNTCPQFGERNFGRKKYGLKYSKTVFL